MVKTTIPRRGRRGSVLIMVAFSIPLFIGLIGLAIDATICYIVQAQLGAAADGAALGAGRLLVLSGDSVSKDIASQFLAANFQTGLSGFWGSTNLSPNITVTPGITTTLQVSATVNVPLIFLRIFNRNSATVGATATATRRAARVEFVIDRSGSMAPEIGTLKSAAEGFVKMFTPGPNPTGAQYQTGADEMGLVVFDSSGVVAYPPSKPPFNLNPTNTAGGPDALFWNQSNPNNTTDMVYQIGTIYANGSTGMGDALALAYIELQRAHMRDEALSGNGQDPLRSFVVLFTDGVPNVVSVYPNNPNDSVLGGTCAYASDPTGSHPIYGTVYANGASTGGGPPFRVSPPYTNNGSSSTYFEGLYQLATTDTNSAHTSLWRLQNPDNYTDPPQYPGNTLACNNNSTTTTAANGWSFMGNLTAMPSKDKYGYPLSPNKNPTGVVDGYKYSSVVGYVSPGTASVYNGTDWVTTQPTNNYQWGLAAWNEVDNVAEAIRSDSNFANRPSDANKMSITIYTIGYTGDGGTDNGLLQKIANVQGCKIGGNNCFNNTQQMGQYAQADNSAQIGAAFNNVAGSILRLSH
jgi:Flp pilus assembly protein TadG